MGNSLQRARASFPAKGAPNREVWIDILRIVLTVLVVVGHGAYYNITTAFGGIGYGHLMELSGVSDTIVHKLFNILVDWIYAYHMPVFFALSGILFQKELARNKYSSLGDLSAKKAKRLLFPLLLVWIVWNLPIKLFTGYYEGIPVWGMFLQIIFSRSVSLWFLEALFFSFLIVFFTVRVCRSDALRFVVLAVLCVIGLVIEKAEPYYVPLGNPFKYSLWLWVGMCTDRLIGILKKYRIWDLPGMILLFLADSVLYLLQLKQILPLKTVCSITIHPFILFIILVYVSQLIAGRIRSVDAIGKIVRLSGYSFGIYLYADTFNYVILRLFYNSFGAEGFGSVGISTVILLLRVAAAPLLAAAVIRLLRKLGVRYIT